MFRVRFGHSWTNAAGRPVEGFREAGLCPACDSGDTSADDLLAFFAVAEEAPLWRVVDFGGHVAAWVESVRRRRVDMVRLRGEERAAHARRLHGEPPCPPSRRRHGHIRRYATP
ncbi:DUF6300 family protein [Streptomyces sp. E2N166]|uniref:DUF6300 family protein n=1 Tax=Streptomyces sp. E2N166 TaxID=1851909 RepID=UPI001EE88958|nr:DUF6300 family protein [Streptomyces sp. E2N166]